MLRAAGFLVEETAGEQVDLILVDARSSELESEGIPIVDAAGVGESERELLTAMVRALARRPAEQEIECLKRRLHDLTRQFESLFAAIPVGLGIAEDPRCDYIRANPALAESLGMRPEQNVSKSAPSTPYRVLRNGREVPPEDLPQQVAARERREVRGDEYEVIRADGTRRYIFGSAAPLFNGDGSVQGSIGVFSDITEHKRAQEALHEASQRLKQHVENSPLAAIEWGPDFRLTRWTGEATRMFGWNAQEMLGRRIDKMRWIHEEDFPTTGKLMQDMLNGRCLRNTNVNRNYCKDGSIIYCEWYNSVLFDSSGGLVSVLSMALDVTERKLAEKALRQSEDMLRTVLDALPVGVWFTDVDGGIVLTNPAATKIWADSPDSPRDHYTEYVGRRPDTGERMRREEWASSEALRTGKPVLDQMVEIECFDGARKVVNKSAVPVLDGAGRVRGTVVLTEDITERKRAEAELRKSEARLARAHRMASLGHWELDPASGELEWSDEVYAIFGVDKAQFRPTEETFYSCLEPEDRAKCSAAMAETLRDGKPYGIDHGVLLPDGTQRMVREHAEAVRDDAGRITRVIGTVQDVTEYRRLEKQFREAQKLESVGRLAGGVAHDFNNLLTVIIGYSDLILAILNESDPAWPNVAEIKKAGERASSLTRQLLAFSRRNVVQPRVIDLNTVIREAEKMLGRMVGEDVSVSALLEPGLWPVMADPGLIHQVLMNLVVNARDAMPEGGKLLIETKNADLPEEVAAQHHGIKAGPHVLLAVSDTGVGMDEAVKARIFEPFFTTKPQGAGTGLGLSTCYGIVHQSGGWIGVYSEPGRGTTFKIYLPRTSEGAPVRDGAGETAEAPRGTETILVVEDQQEVRRFTCDVLRKYGYAVLAAESGDEALKTLSQCEQPIALVVTDLVMPGMTGRELADQIATVRPDLPMLFMSGYSDEIATRQGVLGKEAAYLQKPFSPRALAEKVSEILHGGPQK